MGHRSRFTNHNPNLYISANSLMGSLREFVPFIHNNQKQKSADTHEFTDCKYGFSRLSNVVGLSLDILSF